MLPLNREMAGEFLYVHLFVLPTLSWAVALRAGTQLLPENVGRLSTVSGWVAGNEDGNQERCRPSSFVCSHLLRSAHEHQGSTCGMSTQTGGQGNLVSLVSGVSASVFVSSFASTLRCIHTYTFRWFKRSTTFNQHYSQKAEDNFLAP